MKDKGIIRILQRRKNKLDKARSSLQKQLEQKNDDNSITQMLKQIRSIDRERFLLFKIGEGVAL